MDVRHVNGYLIIPGIVYHLNTKLQKYVLNDKLGENQEMNLINFITRFSYATQRGPHVTLHGAYSCYTSLNETKYIQGCFDNVNRIIPVTIFIVMLYNACFTYQEDKSYNLLMGPRGAHCTAQPQLQGASGTVLPVRFELSVSHSLC